jgi:hypothetical protein
VEFCFCNNLRCERRLVAVFNNQIYQENDEKKSESYPSHLLILVQQQMQINHAQEINRRIFPKSGILRHDATIFSRQYNRLWYVS